MSEPAKKKLMSADDELMRAFELSPEDMAANEAGTVTATQSGLVRQSNAYQLSGEGIAGFVMGSIGLGFSILGVASIFFENQDLPASLGVGLFGLIFLVIGYSILRSRNVKRRIIDTDIEENRLKRLQGIVVVTPEDDDHRGYIEINDQRFDLPSKAVKRVQHLEPYLIHYLEGSNIVVSMERIDVEDDNIKDDMVNRLVDASDDQQSMRASDH